MVPVVSLALRLSCKQPYEELKGQIRDYNSWEWNKGSIQYVARCGIADKRKLSGKIVRNAWLVMWKIGLKSI